MKHSFGNSFGKLISHETDGRAPHKPTRGHCRQIGCPNTFNEVIGGEGWGQEPGNVRGRGGDCIPCLFAAQLRDLKVTPDQLKDGQWGIEAKAFLAETGWSWEALIASYNRVPHPVMM